MVSSSPTWMLCRSQASAIIIQYQRVQLFPATWQILHDPEVYVEPASYSLQRYSEPRELESKNIAFGYGRRHVADMSVFLVEVQFLAVFSLRKAVDEEGVDISRS